MKSLSNHQKKSLPIIAAILAIGAVLAMTILFWNKNGGEGGAGEDAHGHAETEKTEGAKESRTAGEEGSEETHDDEGLVKLSVTQTEKAGITTSIAGPATINNMVKLPGEVRVNDDLTAHVVPRLSGVAESVPAQLGQTVKKGQVLAVISSPDLADLRSAANAAQVRLGMAKTVYEREKKLWQDRISAQQDYQQAEQALREAELALQTARSKLAALEVSVAGGALNRYELRAPFDAVVVEKHITLGEAVQENTNVFVLTDLSRVWVDIAVTPKDLGSVRSGASATVTATGSDLTAVGKVSYVGSLVGAQTRTATARVVIANPGGAWRPGLFVDVMLVQGTKQAAVAVPVNAIQTVEDKPVVFVAVEGGFRAQPVVTGTIDGKGVEILEGLRPGTRYVNGGSFVLKAELGKGSAEHGH
ncbi:efflux RND transporter periplasmic adaptor subunit [Massilia oculi]|jgi:cobalt-zinc-cadmium efflux system membrane fusion protein|uniref:Efflux transporter periplasmic adaptor subunit n=1 Tax=Massilia oculi TaxID=945844 RepID=A0A2S2DQ79_9BURK|nr:efflux RND transporter periplasmic adaptor subunit [Massilia oculi]AWL07550.1 efflux transporter periplasmic adaptor subunit [Massilia oculi]